MNEKDLFYELWEHIADKIELQKYRDVGKSENKILKEQLRFCPWPFMRMSIWPDGTIGACPTNWSIAEDISLPYNIQSDDIRDVWQSQEIQSIRAQIFNKRIKTCCNCQNDY